MFCLDFKFLHLAILCVWYVSRCCMCCCCCCCCRFLTYRALFANTNFLSAQEVSGWNTNIQNLTDRSLHAQWPALTSEISQPVKAYIAHVSWQNGHGGNEETGKILLSNVTSATIGGLDGFSDYSLLIFAIDALGNPYKSSVTNVKTLEGGEWLFYKYAFHRKCFHSLSITVNPLKPPPPPPPMAYLFQAHFSGGGGGGLGGAHSDSISCP